MKTEKILQKIKDLRKKKKMSLAEVADKLGMAAPNYHRIEKGEASLTIDRLITLSEVFEVKLIDLMELDLDNIPQHPNNELQDLVDTLEKRLAESNEKLEIYKNQSELYKSHWNTIVEFANKEIDNLPTELRNKIKEKPIMSVIVDFILNGFSSFFNKEVEKSNEKDTKTSLETETS